MESGETSTDDEIEHDNDPKICVQYFYQGSNRKKIYHFAWALILDNDCISAKFCMHLFESNKNNYDLCMQEYLLLLI